MLILDLPPQIQTIIEEHAQRQGMSAADLAVKALSKQFAPTAPTERVERPFNFDIDELDKAMQSGFKPMPNFNSDEEFLAWVNS